MSSSLIYLLKSNYDATVIEVNEKVINSSALLKNVTELTKTTPTVPIGIDCGGNSLRKFIELVQIHDQYKNDEEKYNLQLHELFQDFTDEALANFINETCIMDSDILLDSLADIILAKLKDMSHEEIASYLEIEDDFTLEEREWQENNMLEYFISFNDPSFPLQFPLLTSQSFYSMKIKFSSPLNTLMARICQRSNEVIAFRLSLCSKALKNECDRHPIKVSRIFINFYNWCLEITTVKPKIKWLIQMKEENEKYLLAIRKRRVLAWNDNFVALYNCATLVESEFNIFKRHSFSLEWMIPHKNIVEILVTISNFETFVSNFDVTTFHYSYVFFDFSFSEEIDFDLVYNHLIVKDLSKEVKLRLFNFSQNISLTIYKKPNTSKFYKCYTHNFNLPKNNKQFLPPKLIAFLKNYMEHDGQFEFTAYHPVIPEKQVHTCSINPRIKYCFVHVLLECVSDK